jgi:hypothetical protein
MINMQNGARVVACDLFEEVEPGRDDSQYKVYGTVLAKWSGGECWATWFVIKHPGQDSFEAHWGKYYASRLLATVRYEQRRIDIHSRINTEKVGV